MITQRFDPESTIKDFKSIVLSHTDDNTFHLRFNIDNDCKLNKLIELSNEFYDQSTPLKLKETKPTEIDIWTDSKFFDLTFEQLREDNMDPKKKLPPITFTGRSCMWTLFGDTKTCDGNLKAFIKQLSDILGYSY